jgi:peptidoglycan/LPS O-acetylase OafA/YrhL
MANALQSPARHINNFDFLRLFFAILVIFSHSFELGVGSMENEPLYALTHHQTTGGSIAVDFFFIMSGYLIAGSFQRSSGVGEFLMKRIRRIYPGFIAAMLFGALIVLPLAGGALVGGNRAARIADVTLNTALLREFWHISAFSGNPYPLNVNGAVWSIRYEFFCYVGLAIAGVSGLLARRKAVAGIFVVLVAVSIWYTLHPAGTPAMVLLYSIGDPNLWAHLAPLFLAGTTAYLYRNNIRFTRNGGLLCAATLLAACFVPFTWNAAFPFAGTYLLMWIALNPSIRLSRAARFGDLSYGTYLYAFPLQQLIVRAAGNHMNPYLLFVVATPLAILFALASWHLVEKPFLQAGRKRATLRPNSPARSPYSAGSAALPSP